MKKQWAKIVNVLDNQVLFYFEPGEEKGFENLHQIVRINGETIDLVLRNIPADKCEAVMTSANEEGATAVLKTVEDLVEGYKNRNVEPRHD